MISPMPPVPPLIALVDDEESVRRALERLLRSAGLRVAGFSSGAALLRGLHDLGPDCIVLDLLMPELSGFDVLDRLPPDYPVVVLTGRDSPEARARAVRAAAFLLKPCDEHTLLDAIASALPEAPLLKSHP